MVSTDILLSDNPFAHPKYDHKAFVSRNSKEIRWPEIKRAAEDLRMLHNRTGVIGYCFGGWSSFSLGSSQFTPRLVDCISAAHPTFLTREEMDNIGVPVQIVAPEKDPVFNPELKKYANEVIPTKGLPYDYSFFPRVEHAFVTRGDLKKDGERVAMLRAKRVQVGWMREWLHGDGKW